MFKQERGSRKKKNGGDLIRKKYPLQTYDDILKTVARSYPKSIAFENIKTDQSCSYEELNKDACAMANYFQDIGISKGDVIAILSTQNIWVNKVWAAAHKIGAVASPLPMRETPKNIVEMISRIDADVLVFDKIFSKLLEEAKDVFSFDKFVSNSEEVEDVDLIEKIFGEYSKSEPDVEVNPTDRSTIQFTSGTTGKPKAIPFDNFQESQCAFASGWSARLDVNPTTLCGFMPNFIGWKAMQIASVCTAGNRLILEEWAPDLYLEILQEKSPDLVFAVYTQWKMAMAELKENPEKYDIKPLGSIFTVGEVAKENVVNQLMEEFQPDYISNTWGASEAFPMGGSTAGYANEKPESIGKPWPTCEMRIVELGGQPEDEVPTGEEGELIVRGPTVASEYIGMPEEEKKAFKDGWFYTGDICYKDEDGDFYIPARKKDMIISGGENIYPAEVEKPLIEHPDVAEVVVAGVTHEKWGEAVKAFIRSPNEDLTEDELDEWCKQHSELANHKRPREYEFWGMEDFPTLSSGKIDKEALLEG